MAEVQPGARKVRRVSGHHAFVLHQYPYSESSLVLELFTRERGRIAALARGAKKPTSNFRALLLPLQLLRVDYSFVESESVEIGSIRSVERAEGPATPDGDALLAGLYLNELLMRMLVRGDAQPEVFHAFRQTCHVLSGKPGQALEELLRAFELVMLRQLGMLPDLGVQTVSQQPLEEEKRYTLLPEVGLYPALPEQRALRGGHWLAIEQALRTGQPMVACMRALGDGAAALKPQLRTALAHYLGGELATQRMMRGLRAL